MNQIKGRHIIGYGLGSMGKDLALGVIGSYLLVFYTDVYGIGAFAATAILVLAKVWDAINDPMMGAIVDRSKRTKMGKYRPYVLVVPIPLAVFSMLCFMSPDLGTAGRIAFAGVTYIITGMLFTAYDVPLWGMVPSLTEDMNTRNKFIASARTFTTLAMLIASAAALPAIYALGGGQETENLKRGYPLFMLLLGVVGIICALIAFISTKERVYAEGEKQQSGNIFKQFLVVANKQLIAVLIMMLLTAMNMLLPSVAGVYYMTYYLQRPDMISIYMMVAMGTGLITTILAPMLMKKFSALTLTKVAFLMSLVSGIIVFAVGRGNLGILFVMFAIAGLSTGFLMVTVTSLLVGAGDSIAKKTGNRVDGVVFSMNSFAIKVGQALASAVVGGILGITGYVANSMEQTDQVFLGILSCRSLLPAAIALIGFLFACFYKQPKED